MDPESSSSPKEIDPSSSFDASSSASVDRLNGNKEADSEREPLGVAVPNGETNDIRGENSGKPRDPVREGGAAALLTLALRIIEDLRRLCRRSE